MPNQQTYDFVSDLDRQIQEEQGMEKASPHSRAKVEFLDSLMQQAMYGGAKDATVEGSIAGMGAAAKPVWAALGGLISQKSGNREADKALGLLKLLAMILPQLQAAKGAQAGAGFLAPSIPKALAKTALGVSGMGMNSDWGQDVMSNQNEPSR